MPAGTRAWGRALSDRTACHTMNLSLAKTTGLCETPHGTYGAVLMSATNYLPPRPVRNWVSKCVAMCHPDEVYWCNGSAEEKKMLLARGVEQKVFIPLNQKILPGCYL